MGLWRPGRTMRILLFVTLGYTAFITLRAPVLIDILPAARVMSSDFPPGAAGSGSTYNCTNAPGPVAAYPAVCVALAKDGNEGQGNYSIRIRSIYTYHDPISGAGSTVCNRQHELAYYKNGVRKTSDLSPTGCLNAATVLASGDFVIFNIPTLPDRDKTVCTRVKNSATSDNWTPYACLAGSALPRIVAN